MSRCSVSEFTCCLIVSTVAVLPLFSSFFSRVCAHAALLSLNTDFLDVMQDTCVFQ